MGRPLVGRGMSLGEEASLGGCCRPSAALTAQPTPPQAAALAVCQYLAVECAHPSSPAFEDGSSSEASTPVPAQHLRPVRARKRRQSPVPALPIVVQLMEMGFPRRNIELALKSLMGASGNAAGLPGAVLRGPPRAGLSWRCGGEAPRSRRLCLQAWRRWWGGCWTTPTCQARTSRTLTRALRRAPRRSCWRTWTTRPTLWSVPTPLQPTPVPACPGSGLRRALCGLPGTQGRRGHRASCTRGAQTCPHTWDADHADGSYEGTPCACRL